MTIQELYDYAKENNALDYELRGTSISCGIHFDVVKIHDTSKIVSIEDAAGWGYGVQKAIEEGFHHIG